MIINRLHRLKLDANRELLEACQGDPLCARAHGEYQQFISDARAWVTARCGRGHLLDLHTTGHDAHWIEVGQMLTGADLSRPDAQLNDRRYVDKSSVRALARLPGRALAEIVRWPQRLGALLEAGGFRAVPGPTYPNPAGGGYFPGGYSTALFGSRDGGTVDATQVEVWFGYVAAEADRQGLSSRLATAVQGFTRAHYRWTLADPSWRPPDNHRCRQRQALSFNAAGFVTVRGTTYGADNEFGARVTCGNPFALHGPQVYYSVPLQRGRSYEVSLLAQFPARYYLFGDTCDGASVSASCAGSGLSGPLVQPNVEHKTVVRPAPTGPHTIAVDSRSDPYYGPFSLTVRTL